MQVVTANFARKLERERDEARREQSSIQCAFEDSQDKIEELERERDEARVLLASEKITRDHVIKRGIEMHKERDEAREQNAKLLSIAERAIDDLGWFYESKADGIILELDQLKEGGK
jgi:chromosome segregation ATPase